METIVLRLLQYISPAFVIGYAYGWLKTIEHAVPRPLHEGYDMPLLGSIALQFICVVGIVASVLSRWQDEESWLGGAMMFIAVMILMLFYAFYSTPCIILYLITGFNFPYLFSILTWGAPIVTIMIVNSDL